MEEIKPKILTEVKDDLTKSKKETIDDVKKINETSMRISQRTGNINTLL